MNKKLTPFLEERLKKGYIQYPPEVAAYWDVLIDWDKRKEGEGNFFIDILRKYKVKKILDVACGTGYDSVRLLEVGFRVKSCDGSLFMLTKARINAEDHSVRLQACFADWIRLKRVYNEKFDAVIFLGNSFCHLFEKEDRISVIQQIYSLLRRKNGILIIDQRNFDKILDRGFSSKHKYVYCGADFGISMKDRSQEEVRVSYEYGKLRFYLNMYPIRLKELEGLLKDAGFKVETYGDFSKKFSPYGPDFFQHVCIKY